MLGHAKLSKTFWDEALMEVAYVINISSSVPLDGDIPQRVWTYKDLQYRHLRIFGCIAYVHVARDQRGKLDPKSQQCIFLGYGDDQFKYRLLHENHTYEWTELPNRKRALRNKWVYKLKSGESGNPLRYKAGIVM